MPVARIMPSEYQGNTKIASGERSQTAMHGDLHVGHADIARLAEAEIAIDSGAAFAHPKESTVAAIGHHEWRMVFE